MDILEMIKQKRDYFIGGGIIIILIIIICILGYLNFNKEEEIVVKEDNILNSSPKEEQEMIKVDIKGQVVKPGVYEIKKDSTVNDLINNSGGLTSIADTSYLNRALKLKDEMVVIVYSKQEIEEFKKGNVTVVSLEKCVCPSITNDGCLKEEKTVTNKKENDKPKENVNAIVNLNTATEEELQTLTGIGPSKALDIIKYREENNGFKKIEELKEVKGIGDATFAKIKSRITI